MSETVKIKLKPYTTLAILKFLREYINDDTKNDSRFAAINEAVEEYENQVYMNMTDEQIEDGIFESRVNDLIGKHPKSLK